MCSFINLVVYLSGHKVLSIVPLCTDAAPLNRVIHSAQLHSIVTNTASPMLVRSGSHRALSQELQRRLAESEEEKTKIKERANRLEEAEKMLHERLEKSLSDSITLRVEMAQSSSEARFQRERCERLESGLEEMRLQLSTSSQRRLDMERMLAQQQEAGRSRDGEILRASEALRAAQDASRRSEIEAEVSKAAESRLLTQLKDAREEVRRQASLSDSVSRIEAGLSSRVEEEKANLVQERDGAMKAMEIFRKQVAERTVIDDQVREVLCSVIQCDVMQWCVATPS